MNFYEDTNKKFTEKEKKIYKKDDRNTFWGRYSQFPLALKLSIYLGILFLIFLIILGIFNIWAGSYENYEKIKELNPLQKNYIVSKLQETWPDKYKYGIQNLPYKINPDKLDVWAKSAIVIDQSNGCIIYEKNPDSIIPPASITKLFVMYVVFKEIEENKVSLDDIVPLPERCWYVNLPLDGTKMYLNKGQTVTLRELLTGLDVASGNDAAYAIASYISGSTEAFVHRMNEECKNLGLNETHFVEPSGYSEKNTTSPRELALFCQIYMKKYGQMAIPFHSTLSFSYPLEKNLPSWEKQFGDTKAITQRNTNPLLGILEGCDGIKTGFINESGYNLALTAKRGDMRFISITMGGPGDSTQEGNKGRIHDGTTLMNWAFESFADYQPSQFIKTFYTVPAPGTSEKFVRLIPAWNQAITVPHITGEKAEDTINDIKPMVTIPAYIFGQVNACQQYGYIEYKIGNTVLEKVPLVADRNLSPSGKWGLFWGKLAARKIAKKYRQ